MRVRAHRVGYNRTERPGTAAPTLMIDRPPLTATLNELAAALDLEQARSSVHAVGASTAILLERGPVPFGDHVAPLPPSNRAQHWADERRREPGRPTWIGWPLAHGHRRVAGIHHAVHAALLVAPARRHGTGLTAGGPAVVNDAALDLLEIPADEQALLHAELDPLLQAGAPVAELVAVLHRRRLAPSGQRTELAPVDHASAVSATALAWVGVIDDAPDLAARQRDLRALAAAATAATDDSPLWQRIGRPIRVGDPVAPAALPAVVEPQPALLPVTRAQEQVVAASRERMLTVATGAPGSGRTRTAVHVALAAVAAGERALVLVADPRHAAALHEQLGAVHPGAFPLLATGQGAQATLARTIDRALHHPVDGFDDPELADAAWARAATRIRPAYARRAARLANEQALAQARRDRRDAAWVLNRARRRSDHVGEDVDAAGELELGPFDHARLEAELPDARAAVAGWRAAAGRGPRDRLDRRGAHRRARRAVERLLATVDGEHREAWAAAVERDELDVVLDGAEALARYATASATVDALQAELDGRTDDDELCAEIDASYASRLGPSLSLSRARWAAGLQARAEGRVPARRFQLALVERQPGNGNGNGTRSGTGDGEVPTRIEPEALEAFPLWVATPAGASTALPLVADLFDVVVVDDADRLDLAEGLPALARARRVVVTGAAGPASGSTRDTVWAGAAAVAADHGDAPCELDAPFRPPTLVAAFVDDHLEGPVIGTPTAPSTPTPRVTADPPALGWLDHAGGFAPGPGRRSGTNAGEAIAVVELVTELLAGRPAPIGPRLATDGSDTIDLRDVTTDAVAVVAPLAAQRAVLRDLLRERFGGRVTVAGYDDVDALECDVVICSPAVGVGAPDELVAYATDRTGLAAALRRARQRVIVVGDHGWFVAGTTPLAALARSAVALEPGSRARRAVG